MKTFTKALLAIIVGLSISGCTAKSGNTTLGKMEKSQIDRQIIKGKTNKEGIRKIFGDPQFIDLEISGIEKWTYIHNHADGKIANYIPYYNMISSGADTTTKSLIILFGSNGVVKNYSSSISKGETKGGLF